MSAIPENPRIAALLIAPPGETVDEQRARCEEWARLAKARLKASRRTAYEIAVDAEPEPHWWRDLSFVLPDAGMRK